MAHNWPQNQRPESRCHYLADCKGLSTPSFRSGLVNGTARNITVTMAQRFTVNPQNHRPNAPNLAWNRG